MESPNLFTTSRVLIDLKTVLDVCENINDTIIDYIDFLEEPGLTDLDRLYPIECEIELVQLIAGRLEDLRSVAGSDSFPISVHEFGRWCARYVETPLSLPIIPLFVVELLLTVFCQWYQNEWRKLTPTEDADKEEHSKTGERSDQADPVIKRILPRGHIAAGVTAINNREHVPLDLERSLQTIDSVEGTSVQPDDVRVNKSILPVDDELRVEDMASVGYLHLEDIFSLPGGVESFQLWLQEYHPERLLKETGHIATIDANRAARFRVYVAAHQLALAVRELWPNVPLLMYFARLSRYATRLSDEFKATYPRFHKLHNRLISLEQLLSSVHPETIVDVTSDGKLYFPVGVFAVIPKGDNPQDNEVDVKRPPKKKSAHDKPADALSDEITKLNKRMIVAGFLRWHHSGDGVENHRLKPIKGSEIVEQLKPFARKNMDVSKSSVTRALYGILEKHKDLKPRLDSGAKPTDIYLELCKSQDEMAVFLRLCEAFLKDFELPQNERTNLDMGLFGGGDARHQQSAKE